MLMITLTVHFIAFVTQNIYHSNYPYICCFEFAVLTRSKKKKKSEKRKTLKMQMMISVVEDDKTENMKDYIKVLGLTQFKVNLLLIQKHLSFQHIKYILREIDQCQNLSCFNRILLLELLITNFSLEQYNLKVESLNRLLVLKHST